MKNILLSILILFFVGEKLYSQHTFGGHKVKKQEYFFAYKLVPTASGELVQCAVIHKHNGRIDEVEFLTKKAWAEQITGQKFSKANPEKENLIKKNGVFEVPSEVSEKGEDEINLFYKEGTVSILRNMWRLRYSEYPYRNTDKSRYNEGWVLNNDTLNCIKDEEGKTVDFQLVDTKTVPSKNQQSKLKGYGVKRYIDFVYDQNAFDLMKDIMDQEFQKSYNENPKFFKTDSTNVSPKIKANENKYLKFIN